MSENQENNTNVQVQPKPAPQPAPQPQPQPQPNYNYTNPQNNIPKEYKPLSAWAYVGYNLLFSLPLVGFIMLIVYSLDNSNINRRNYARSFFCAMLLGFIIAIILLVILFVILGVSFSTLETNSFNFSM